MFKEGEHPNRKPSEDSTKKHLIPENRAGLSRAYCCPDGDAQQAKIDKRSHRNKFTTK